MSSATSRELTAPSPVILSLQSAGPPKKFVLEVLSPSLSQVNAVLEALTPKEPLIELLSVIGLAMSRHS